MENQNFIKQVEVPQADGSFQKTPIGVNATDVELKNQRDLETSLGYHENDDPRLGPLPSGDQVLYKKNVVDRQDSYLTEAPLSANQGRMLAEQKAEQSSLVAEQGRISTLETVSTDHEKRIGDLETLTDKHTDQINQNTEKNKTQDSLLQTHTENIAGHTILLEQVQTYITDTLEPNVGEITQNVSNIVSQADTDRNRISELERSRDSHTGDLNDIHATLTNHEDRLNILEGPETKSNSVAYKVAIERDRALDIENKHDGRLHKLEDDIKKLNGAMHFIGVSSTDPATGKVTINGKEIPGEQGDVVIYISTSENPVLTISKEYIKDKEKWVELGDTNDEEKRLTTLESQLKDISKNPGSVKAAIEKAIVDANTYTNGKIDAVNATIVAEVNKAVENKIRISKEEPPASVPDGTVWIQIP